MSGGSALAIDMITTVTTHIYGVNLLSRGECQREVSAPVLRVQLGEVERIRVEMVYESAERQAVSPARRKVGYVDILQKFADPPQKWSLA